MTYLSKEKILEEIKGESTQQALTIIVSHARNRLASIIGYVDLLSLHEEAANNQDLLEKPIDVIKASAVDLQIIFEAATDYLEIISKSD
jgi:hypothetical protein